MKKKLKGETLGPWTSVYFWVHLKRPFFLPRLPGRTQLWHQLLPNLPSTATPTPTTLPLCSMASFTHSTSWAPTVNPIPCVHRSERLHLCILEFNIASAQHMFSERNWKLYIITPKQRPVFTAYSTAFLKLLPANVGYNLNIPIFWTWRHVFKSSVSLAKFSAIKLRRFSTKVV